MRAVPERAGPMASPIGATVGADSWLGLAFLGVVACLIAAAIFAGGGSSDESIPWIGGGALVLAAGASALAITGRLAWPRPTAAGVASFSLMCAFVIWNGITIAWSIMPDRSWDYFNRGLVYVLFLALGLFAGTLGRRAVSTVAAGLGAFATLALLWALAGKAVPALNPDGSRIARLREPVEYWNALALLFAIGLPVALWLASARELSSRWRAAAAIPIYAFVVGLILTYSRAGVLAAALAVAFWLVLADDRATSFVSLAAAVPLGIAVGVWALGQPGIALDEQPHSVRVRDGAELGVALVLGAILTSGAAVLLARIKGRRRVRRPSMRSIAGVLASAAVLVLAFKGGDLVDWGRTQADEFANPPTDLLTQEPGRLASLSSNNRWGWWQEAWSSFRANPLEGTGAGSFPLTHRLLRDDPLRVAEPHSEPLQFLAETGIVGAALAGAACVAGLLGLREARRRLTGREQAAASALAAGFAAYVAHSLVDWDWDFVAVNAPAFLATGTLFSAGLTAAQSRKKAAWLAAPAALLVACTSCLILPWLADERVRSSYRLLARGQPAEGLAAAEDARTLNPLSLDAFVASAAAASSLGDSDAARETLIDAVSVHSLNPDAWYELGALELDVGNRPQAIRYLRRSQELDRFGPAPPLLAQLQ